MSFLFNINKYNLKDYNDLYKNTVSHFNKETKIQYCENLLARSRFDILNATNKNEVKKFRIIIEATENEIKILKG